MAARETITQLAFPSNPAALRTEHRRTLLYRRMLSSREQAVAAPSVVRGAS
jgi:hypothetical protein